MNYTWSKSLFIGDIAEYDIISAGYSIVVKYKLIDDAAMQSLIALKDKKFERNLLIGRLSMNNDLAMRVTRLIDKHITRFIKKNSISDQNIVSIKRDAVFMVAVATRIKLDTSGIKFKLANYYSGFIKIDRMEFYFLADDIVIKNSHADKTNLFLTKVILQTFKMVQQNYPKNRIIDFLDKTQEAFISASLDTGFYKHLKTNEFLVVYKQRTFTVDKIRNADRRFCLHNVMYFYELRKIIYQEYKERRSDADNN